MKTFFCVVIVLTTFSLYAQNRYQIDPAFRLDAVSAGAFSIVVKEQADGRLLVGGSFDVVEGSDLSHLVRLNSDGTLDETFNSGGTGPSDHVQDI